MKEEEFLVLVENYAKTREEQDKKQIETWRSMIDNNAAPTPTLEFPNPPPPPPLPDEPHKYVEIQNDKGEWTEPQEANSFMGKVLSTRKGKVWVSSVIGVTGFIVWLFLSGTIWSI